MIKGLLWACVFIIIHFFNVKTWVFYYIMTYGTGWTGILCNLRWSVCTWYLTFRRHTETTTKNVNSIAAVSAISDIGDHVGRQQVLQQSTIADLHKWEKNKYFFSVLLRSYFLSLLLLYNWYKICICMPNWCYYASYMAEHRSTPARLCFFSSLFLEKSTPHSKMHPCFLLIFTKWNQIS